MEYILLIGLALLVVWAMSKLVDLRCGEKCQKQNLDEKFNKGVYRDKNGKFRSKYQ